MARSLTSGMITELTGVLLRPIILVEIEFTSGFVRVWTGIGDLTWDSKTWTGVGDLGRISAVQESGDLSAAGMTVTLSGIPQAMVDRVLSETRQGKPFNVWLGMLDSSDAVIADPYLIFGGLTDISFIDEGAKTATVGVTGENKLLDRLRIIVWFYTSESQTFHFPGDKGFDFVPSSQERLQWGIGSNIPGPPPGFIPIPGQEGTSAPAGSSLIVDSFDDLDGSEDLSGFNVVERR